MKDKKKIEHISESSAMRKKKIAKNLFLAVCSVFLAGSVTGLAVACDEDTPPPIITEGVETGVYYFTEDGKEYVLTLNSGNLFTVVGGTENRSGYYTVADGVITFSFVKIGEEDAIVMSGTIDGDVLTVNYDGAATRFLKKVTYTVSFNTNGANETVEAVTVMNGKTISVPAAVTKDNCSFVGWYTDEACATPFLFGTQPITANTTLYAKWVDDVKGQKEYLVDFDLGYEADAPEAKTTIEGKLYGVTNPTRTGYTFAGWWMGIGNSANKLTAEWTEDTVFDANTTLYALWTAKPEGGKLATPVVHVSGTNVKWSGVENAQSYQLIITDANGTEIENAILGATSKNVDFANKAAGEYKIVVKAISSDETKNSEEAVRYFANKMLARVSQFSVIEPSVLLFNPVENAEGYLITVQCGTDGHVHTQFNNGSSTTYNFSNCDAKDGVLQFTVTAVANGYASSVSETYTYIREPLSEVKGLYVDAETEILVWETVEGATNYVVEVTCGNANHVHIVNNGTKTSYDLKECTADADGEITITVRAEAKGYDSAEATEYVYEKTKLAAPSGLILKDTTLTWNAVSGATSYVVKVGSQTFTTTATSIDLALTGVNFVGGNIYEVSVYAKSDDNESLFSNVLSVSYYAMNTNLTYKNGMVSWKPVMGAKVYEIKLSTASRSERISDGSYSCPITFTKAGVNTIMVRYYDGESYSDWASVDVFVHEIIFDSRSGENVGTMYKANGDVITLPETERTGYNFNGWYNAPGGAAGNAAKFDGGVLNVSGSIALYAYWTPATVKVTYNVGGAEGATVAVPETAVTYTEGYQLHVPTSPSEEVVFMGWFSAPNCLESDRLTDNLGVSIKNCDFATGATAYAGWANALKFTERSNGTYAVSKGPEINKLKEVRIPAYYNGELVTLIDAYSFQYCSKLEKIYIPDTIELIERNVFYNCPKLASIEMYTPEVEPGYNYDVIWETVDDVLLRNMTDQTGHKQIYFVPAAKVGKIAIPEGVTEVPSRVFTGVKVTELVIPTTVQVIRQKAFLNCDSLKKITFAPSTEGEEATELVIETNAFQNCTRLTSVSLPKRLKDISIDQNTRVPDVFTGCDALAYVHIEEGSSNYASLDGMLTTTNKTEILFCPAARAGVVTIPNVINIAPYAFKDCDRITEISIPSCVTMIGESAFEGCDRLIKVSFEETDGVGAAAIGKNAFKDCVSIKELNFHAESEVVSIGESAFEGCLSLSSLSFHKRLTSIEARAFAGCKNIKTLTFAEDGVELSLGDYSFDGCLSLSEVTLPGNITNLALGAFSGCQSLVKIFVADSNTRYCDIDGVVYTKDKSEIIYYSVARKDNTYTLPAETTKIGGAVFKGNMNLRSFVIPARVTYIGESAFENCNYLKTLTIEEGTDALTVGKNAFKNCGTNSSNKLERVVFPARTASIGEGALYGCNRITTVTLPEGLTAIPADMFYNCTRMTTVNVPSTVVSIGNNAFYGCSAWTNNNQILTLGNGLVSIGSYAFNGCTKIVGVQIPDTLTSIGVAAFNGCTKLATANLPASLTVIPESVFASTGLTSFTFSDNVTTIGNNAFKSTKLTKIVIPASVTTIGQYAFGSITTLVDTVEEDEVTQAAVTFADGTSIATIGTNVFAAAGSATATIIIPNSVTTIAQSAFSGAKFGTVDFEANGAQPLVIGTDAFTSATLTSIVLPDRLTEIGVRAFKSCTALATVTINPTSQLTTIRSYAFQYCSALTSIYIPKTVRDLPQDGGATLIGIGDGAFHNATALETITFEMDDETTKETSLTIGKYTVFGAYEYQKSWTMNITGTVKFPARLKDLGQDAFRAAVNLTAFEVQDGSAYFSAQDGILYSADKSTLYLCPNGKEGEVVVPNTVTLVKYQSFYQCSKITKVTFTDAEEGSAVLTTGMILGDGVSTSQTISVNDSVFDGCKALAEVILPNYLKEIGPMAFGGNNYSSTAADKRTDPAMTSITIPASVQIIQKAAFYNCRNLTTVIFAEDSALKEIGASAFYGSALTAVEIPASVEMIADSAFYTCWQLASLTFEDYTETGSKLTDIGQYAFRSTALSGDMILPDSVTALGAQIFGGCTFNTITVPKNVSTLYNTFGSTKMSAIVVDEANTTYVSKDGVLYSRGMNTNGVSSLDLYPCNKTAESYEVLTGTQSISASAFVGNTSLASVTIPNTVKSIGASAFDGLSCLEEVIFEDGGDELIINNYAFRNCWSIETLEFPAQLKSIGNNAFDGLGSLYTMTFAEGCQLETIGDNAFVDTCCLENLKLPANLISIGANAFNCACRLGTLTLNDGLETIGAGAFNGAYIEDLVIPNSVTSIGVDSFANGAVSGTLTLSNGLTEIPAGAFNYAYITELVIPDGVTVIGDGAFANCSILSKITFSPVLETIGNNAFYNCGTTTNASYAKLKEIDIPASVRHIGNNAFKDCINLETITLRDGILSIGDLAFANCSKVTVMYLPATLETLGTDPFTGITFEEFGVDPGNTSILLENGMMYDATQETILKYFGSDETVTIPFRVTKINGGAFANNPYVKEIVLHDGITYIGDYAFQYTQISGDIVFGKGLTYLGDYAFEGCENITSIAFQDDAPNLRRIGEGAFMDCTSLQSVVLPKGLETLSFAPTWEYMHGIGDYAFFGCSSLSSVDFSKISRYYSIGQYAFAYTNLTSVTINSYCSAAGNNQAQELADIDSYAFAYCENLTTVVIEGSGWDCVAQMGDGCFKGCENLETATHPDDFMYIYLVYSNMDPFVDTPLEGEYF